MNTVMSMAAVPMGTTGVSMDPTTVFICSAGHSGSTLLDLLLGSHRDAISLGEITQMPKNLALNTPCSCGAPVRECELWRDVIARLSRQERFAGILERPYDLYLGLFVAGTVIDRRHQTPLRKLYRRGVYAAAYAHWSSGVLPDVVTTPLVAGARNKGEVYRAVASASSKSVLIDSSKHYLEGVALYRTAPERTKILLLARDGRAVFYSGLKRGRLRRDALNAWLLTNRRALRILEAKIPSRDLLRVRYESLAADPAVELRRICQFIGLPFDARMLDFRSRVHHILSGNDMRLSSSAAIRADTAWREHLKREDLDYFERHAGSFNRALGYE
jgi:hypothetical protein